MPVQDITPTDAQAMREADAAVPYLDVRSAFEFGQGHAAGAYNIPLMHFDPVRQEMSPNADFERVVRAAFPTDRPVIVGCKAGPRSTRATQVMESLGFQDMHNVLGGFAGGEDEYGEPQPGWLDAGLPVATTPEPGRDYESLLAAAS